MTTDLTDWYRQVADEHRREQQDIDPEPRDDWFWDEYGDAEKAWKE